MASAIDMITQAVSADEFRKSLQVHEKLNDLVLTQKGLAVLLGVRDVEMANFSVEKGTAFLSGMVRSLAAKEARQNVLLKVQTA